MQAAEREEEAAEQHMELASIFLPSNMLTEPITDIMQIAPVCSFFSFNDPHDFSTPATMGYCVLRPDETMGADGEHAVFRAMSSDTRRISSYIQRNRGSGTIMFHITTR